MESKIKIISTKNAIVDVVDSIGDYILVLDAALNVPSGIASSTDRNELSNTMLTIRNAIIDLTALLGQCERIYRGIDFNGKETQKQ